MSETPTPPAVSEAMREAVARDDAREKHLADIVDRYVTDCTLVHRTLTEEDVWLLEGLAFGPIASEIARLTGELADAKSWANGYRVNRELLLKRTGELHSEIARLTGERDAARELAASTQDAARDAFASADEIEKAWDEIGVPGSNRKALTLPEQLASIFREHDAAIEAAEAETARLRAALEDLCPEGADGLWFSGDDDGQQGFAVVSKSAFARARAALTSQEKTDV